MDLQKDLSINKFQLDRECQTHPAIYHDWADKLADAKAEADAAKDNLKLILAERAVAIRNEWPSETKLTEAAVNAALESDSFVLQARTELRQADANVYHLEAAVKAMEHKKAQLDNLTVLFSRSYFSMDASQGQSKLADDVSSSLRKGLKKRKEEDE